MPSARTHTSPRYRHALRVHTSTCQYPLIWRVLGYFLILLGTGIQAGEAHAEPDDTLLPLSEVRAGMQGYGLTVFQGSRVDTFRVEVLGVQQNIRADGSLILVEISGPGVDLGAISQGMSGSPVFLEGKLAGAVALGWSGALRPIVGLTPAEEMLALPTGDPALSHLQDIQSSTETGLLDLLPVDSSSHKLADDLFGNDPGPDWSAPAQQTPAPGNPWEKWPEPTDLAARLFESVLGAGHPADDTWQALPTGWLYRPLGGHESLAQISPAGNETLQRNPLVPGASCAIPLVLGDAQLGAIGTTTWVEGDRVFLMGHPFMQLGPIALPLATSEIITVLPSRQMSFKLGSIGRVVGTVYHDQRAGLTGHLGSTPELVNVSVSVDRSRGRENYGYQVAKDVQLTPALVFWALYNSLLVQGDDMSRQTITYDISTSWQRGSAAETESIRLTGAVAGPGSAMSLGPEWMAPLQILLTNRAEPMALTDVTAHLKVSRPMITADIAALHAPDQARAGQTITVTAVLEPRRGSPQQQEWQLTIPSYLPAGSFRLLAASARDLFALETERAAARFSDPSLPATLDLLRTPRSATDLVVALFVPSRGVVVDGEELPTLPSSVADLLRESSSGRVSPTRAGIAWLQRQESEFVLSGHVIQKIRIHQPTEPIREDTRP